MPYSRLVPVPLSIPAFLYEEPMKESPAVNQNPNGPERMRSAVADYVREVHAAYLRTIGTHAAAVQGRMPLLSPEPLSVAAVGARYLHLIATRERLGDGARGTIASVAGEAGPIRWTVHFYDPSVVPALGLLDERDGPAADAVREAIGLRTHLYHLTLRPPADLAAHHAGHTGAGLAGAHAQAAREFDAVARSMPLRTALANEFEGASVAGLPIAAALLARAIAPYDASVTAAAGPAGTAPTDLAGLRKAVLAAVRPPTPSAGVDTLGRDDH